MTYSFTGASDEAANHLKRFHLLQQERVQAYQLFDEGHRAYLSGAPHYNFPMYRQLVHEITQAFKKLSDEVMTIEMKFVSEYDLPDVGKFIRKVQDEEKTKLEVTVKLQLAKQNAQDDPNNCEYQEEIEELQERIKDIIERINEHLDELKYESEDLLKL